MLAEIITGYLAAYPLPVPAMALQIGPYTMLEVDNCDRFTFDEETDFGFIEGVLDRYRVQPEVGA